MIEQLIQDPNINITIRGLIILIFSYFIIRLEISTKTQGWGIQSTTLVIITLIVACAMYLATYNNNSDTMTSIIGLMGTIIGFLLGRFVDVMKKE